MYNAKLPLIHSFLVTVQLHFKTITNIHCITHKQYQPFRNKKQKKNIIKIKINKHSTFEVILVVGKMIKLYQIIIK